MQINKDTILIESIGHLLAYYRTDLRYISTFQAAVQSESEAAWTEYIKDDGIFAAFLSEFRIARGFEKGKRGALFRHVRDFVHSQDTDNVDMLADKLKSARLTHGKTATSLASKILFLNNPAKILPYDANAKWSLGYRGNKYSEFMKLVENQSPLLKELYNSLPEVITEFSEYVEDQFGFADPISIRESRFTDKVLWTLGRNRMTLSCLRTRGT